MYKQAVSRFAVVACLAGMPAVQAQEQATNSSEQGTLVAGRDTAQVYERNFFDQFTPQTARDMIDRLPGFTLDSGDNLRGFGGAAGNVLIDGERPSSKVGGIAEALGRIPANQVARIEVIRGSAGSGEAAGQAVVANVIRVKQGAAGSWEVKLERAADGILYPAGEVTVVRQVAGWKTSTRVNAFWERFPSRALRSQLDAEGNLTSSQDENRPTTLTDAFISSEAERPLGGGTLTLTGRFGRSAFFSKTDRLGFDGRLPDARPDDRLFIDFDSIFYEGEFGADWNKKLDSGWTLKLLSLSSFQDLDQQQTVSDEEPFGTLDSSSLFTRARDQFESVLRGSLTSAGGRKFKPEFGAEFAYNRTDSKLALSSTDAAGGVSIINLPAANVLVEEVRGEAYSNLIWQAGGGFSMETGVAAELSQITVSGDAESTQSFFFVKPFATAIYDVQKGLQLRLGLRRTVGQLDFNQFAASASAADDRLLAGNPELGPDQTTRASFTVDLRSEKRGALNVELFHEWRDDIIEQVELPSGAFGSANAGNGRIWGVTANTSIPLSPVVPGGLLEVEADFRESTFRDPLSGTRRDISNVSSPTVLVEFRQDLPDKKLAWGVSYRAAQERRFFFADEISFTREGENWRAFLQSTHIKGWRTTLEVRDIGGQNFFRERAFFDPSRAADTSGSEVIDRNRGAFVSLTIAGQF
ncbi:MAG: TonB-dependent receptor plug domain-containing protein [Kordiimonadaceae bacterium]|nr:TonB-dependent receptor plug domain-containing protein [Kordiimonadaceae bacterium]MBO6567270.1 TonB-dependent receptor plug domain-containing protein [Kordiimonadaceae bacterium]MBO6963516.1 TonB-dependent receptor plug domain-containing protein [Kordiimonadaceae bacterium]